jgi:hypothetical protein
VNGSDGSGLYDRRRRKGTRNIVERISIYLGQE